MSVPFVPPVGPPFVLPGPAYVSGAPSLFPNEGPTVAPPSVIPPATSSAIVTTAKQAPVVTSYVPYQKSDLATQQAFGLVNQNTVLINGSQALPQFGT